MKKLFIFFILILIATTTYAFSPAIQAVLGVSLSLVLDDSFPVENIDSEGSGWLCSTYNKSAQSFTSGGGELNRIEVSLFKAGSPTGNLVVKIYAHTGTYGSSSLPTGAALATSDTLDIATLTTSSVTKSIAFSGANRISLSAATYYTAVVESANGDCSTNRVEIDRGSGHDGNSSYYDTSWHIENAVDIIFYVYVMR